MIFYRDEWIELHVGDVREVLKELPDGVAQCCVTSPPYFGLRDYGTAEWEGGDAECDHVTGRASRTITDASAKQTTNIGAFANETRAECPKCGAIRIDAQIGLEASPSDFIDAMVEVFDGVKRVLKRDGSVFVNLGDSFNGSGKGGNPEGSPHTKQKTNAGSLLDRPTRLDCFKPKDLMLIPHTTAMALRDRGGWWLRQAFPYVKKSAMPESVTDRAANALEYVFHLTVSKHSFYDSDGVRVGMAATSVQRLSQNIDAQAGSTRANGGAKTNGPMKAVGNRGHGTIHKHGRTPASWKGSSFAKGKTGDRQQTAQSDESRIARDRSLPTNRNGITGSLDETPAGTRNMRNTDLWFESVDGPHGLTFLGDDIVGIDCNPEGFSAEFCTACGRYYHDAKDKREIEREEVDGKTVSHCICGRTDAWLSHFATFPVRFAASFIKAATSEAGECSECGVAWVRDVEISGGTIGRSWHDHSSDIIAGQSQYDPQNHKGGIGSVDAKAGNPYCRQTLGWSPQCQCKDAHAVPQTVFEPFSGAATTLIAARKLGRRAIGVELNEEYARMSIERYKRVFREPVDPPRRAGALPLFETTR